MDLVKENKRKLYVKALVSIRKLRNQNCLSAADPLPAGFLLPVLPRTCFPAPQQWALGGPCAQQTRETNEGRRAQSGLCCLRQRSL